MCKIKSACWSALTCALTFDPSPAGVFPKAAGSRPSFRSAAGCDVPCKMFWDQLGDLCRRERLQCRDLGVSRANINDYEVEFLCDYKKTKVRPVSKALLRSQALFPLALL